MWAMMARAPERDERLAELVDRIELQHRMDMSQDTAFNAIYVHRATEEDTLSAPLSARIKATVWKKQSSVARTKLTKIS